MIKYKLKENSIPEFSFNYLRDYLKSLGIEKTESFISQPTEEDEESYNKLDNINQAIDWLYEGFKNNKKFFLQVDSDTDGITSSAIFYSFFKELFPKADIEYRLHDGKEHGVIMDTVPIIADYVIIPDAGSVQFDEQELLNNKGYKVIILDHHKVYNPPELENVVIVNNQNSKDFKNKNLSGAGIVYKTIQAFNNKYKDEFPIIYEKFADLAALGIISDMMDTKNLDNNFIIWKGLNNINNKMLRVLLKRQYRGGCALGGVSNPLYPNKIDIAWYIAPIINGVIRFGTSEEKELLFKGFIDDVDFENEVIETVYRGVVRRESFYEYVARTSDNIRNKQNREKEKCMKFLSEKVEKEELNKNQLLIVKVSKNDEVIIPQTITGLVAMELLKIFKKPTLVLRPKNMPNGKIMYAGSGRGKQNEDFDSLYGFLRDSGFCDYVEGHSMAHGVGIYEENIESLIEYANKKLSEIQFDVDEIEIDYIFDNYNINKTMITQIANGINIYGNGIPQPKFLFNLTIPRSNISILGEKKETIKFVINDMEFISFKNKELAEKVNSGQYYIFKATLVGRSQINNFSGTPKPQIFIDQIEMEGEKLEKLF